MTDDKRLSNSELTSARRCPRRWYLQYYRKLTPASREMVGPRSIGSRVHDALAAYYESGQDPVALWTNVEAGAKRDVELVDADHMSEWIKDVELVKIMLEGYLEYVTEDGLDMNIEYLAAEEELTYPITEKHNLTGKLDARVRDVETNEQYFIDHKTVQSFSQATAALQLDTQMLTYQLLRRLLLGKDDIVTGGLYNMLRKVKRTKAAKPPFYVREKVHHNDAELRNHWRHVSETARQIEAWESRLDDGADHQDVVPPNPTRDCSWQCDFFAVCPLFDDGSAAEEMLQVSYRVWDPYERYDEKGDA